MKRLLLAELKQETATFNPAPTTYDDFRIHRGEEIRADFHNTATEIAGALDEFALDADLQVVPTVAASAVSGGPIHEDDLGRLLDEILERVRDAAPVDGAYIVLHGAMAGESEMDPEGRLLVGIREILRDVPLVASLDLHAVLTDRMLESADILVPYHTYPHTDHYETGQRAAANLRRLLAGEAKPAVARIPMHMLVRGDELLTATGLFGEAMRMCQKIEAEPNGLAAGVLIGNPFTDVPALQSNVIVTTNGDAPSATASAERLAKFMWERRDRLVAELTSLEEAIDIATSDEGLTIFSDAADATASGAPGDSNAILRGLLEREFPKRALLSVVDRPAVEAAFDAGIGATLDLKLGGSLDPDRHTPLPVTAYVKSLSDGDFTYEDGTHGQGGRTAVLRVGQQIHVLATERSVYVVGRKVYQAQGLDPTEFDLVIVKSPNGFRTHYESIATRIVPVDVPGATSANLRSLPYERCVRPIFPLDENVSPPL